MPLLALACGVQVRITGRAAMCSQILLDFPAAETCGPPPDGAGVEVTCGRAARAAEIPPGAELESADPVTGVASWLAGDVQVIVWPGCGSVVRSAAGPAQVRCTDDQRGYGLVRSELVQALRRQVNATGALLAHSGLIARPGSGRGVLVTGDKGAGKTSMCALAARAGLDVRTDELCVLTLAPSGRPLASGIPRRMGFSQESLDRRFPELRPEVTGRVASPLDGEVKLLARPRAMSQVVGDPVEVAGVIAPTVITARAPKVLPVSSPDLVAVLFAALSANELTPQRAHGLAHCLARVLPGRVLAMGTDARAAESLLWEITGDFGVRHPGAERERELLSG
jgi:hypothetical protein